MSELYVDRLAYLHFKFFRLFFPAVVAIMVSLKIIHYYLLHIIHYIFSIYFYISRFLFLFIIFQLHPIKSINKTSLCELWDAIEIDCYIEQIIII